MSYKAAKTVIAFKEKTNPEKQKLQEFLLQNNIQFVKNASGTFDAVIHMRTPSEENASQDYKTNKDSSGKHSSASLSRSQSKKTLTDISNAESTNKQNSRSNLNKSSSVSKSISNIDDLGRQSSQISLRDQEKNKTKKDKAVPREQTFGRTSRNNNEATLQRIPSGRSKSIKNKNSSQEKQDFDEKALKALEVELQKELYPKEKTPKKEQSRFTTDFNDRWRLNKLKNMQPPHQVILQQEKTMQLPQRQLQEVYSEINSFSNKKTENNLLKSKPTASTNKEINASSQQIQTAVFIQQPPDMQAKPVGEKKALIQLKKIQQNDKVSNQNTDKKEQQQQQMQFTINLYENKELNDTNSSKTKNKGNSSTVKKPENSINNNRSPGKSATKKENTSNFDSPTGKFANNSSGLTVQSEVFSTPQGKRIKGNTAQINANNQRQQQEQQNQSAAWIEKKDDRDSKRDFLKSDRSNAQDRNNFGIGSSQFSLNDRAHLSPGIISHNTSKGILTDSSINDRMSYLQSALFSANHESIQRNKSSVRFDTSHDYSPVEDYQQMQQVASNDPTSNNYSPSNNNISSNPNNTTDSPTREELKVQQASSPSSPPPSQHFEQEYFSFSSSPNRYSPTKMITSLYSNILKDDPWLEVLKEELSQPVVNQSKNQNGYDSFSPTKEVNLKQLSSNELVQYYRFVMEKARIQSTSPLPQPPISRQSTRSSYGSRGQ